MMVSLSNSILFIVVTAVQSLSRVQPCDPTDPSTPVPGSSPGGSREIRRGDGFDDQDTIALIKY